MKINWLVASDVQLITRSITGSSAVLASITFRFNIFDSKFFQSDKDWVKQFELLQVIDSNERKKIKNQLKRLKDRTHYHLIAAIDDATSELLAEFFPSQTTAGCLKMLRSFIEKRGIFKTLYVDRAGIFGDPKRSNFSQMQRATSGSVFNW